MPTNVKRLAAAAGHVLVIGVAVVGLTACGGKKSETTATATTSASPSVAWAGSVCGALGTWRTEVVAAGQAARANPTKTGVEQALKRAEAATTSLQTALKGLEKPPTAAGGQARTELQQLKGELQNDLAVIERTIKNVSASGGISSATSTVKAAVATMRSQVADTAKELRSLPNGELEQAFNDADACKSLKAASSS